MSQFHCFRSPNAPQDGVLFAIGLGILCCLAFMHHGNFNFSDGDAPNDLLPPYENYNRTLKQICPGRNAAVLDVEKLDHNCELVRTRVGSNFKLRLVTKSLPSMKLLKYIMKSLDTNRLMVFSEPYLTTILNSFEPSDVNILMGKPLHVEAVKRLSTFPGWSSVHWLIDSIERLKEYVSVAEELRATMLINIEIDIGLHRGGIETLFEFNDILSLIQSHSENIRLTGLMGYDGHVPYVPFYFNKHRAYKNAFSHAINRYESFVNELRKQYTDSEISQFELNSGGSKTYHYYKENLRTSINDISLGSALLSPTGFHDVLEPLHHEPALLLASPILKRIKSQILPHVPYLSKLVYLFYPELEVSYYMAGGGWAGRVVFPQGLRRNKLFGSTNEDICLNMLPNQSLLSSRKQTDFSSPQVGDFVIYVPHEGDAVTLFNQLLVFRGHQLIDKWDVYRGGN